MAAWSARKKAGKMVLHWVARLVALMVVHLAEQWAMKKVARMAYLLAARTAYLSVVHSAA